ncbi:MAG: hypothetical protein V4640_15845 [Verrucomicrobiota bacterium]
MKRIWVTGNAGSGKSTLAKRIAAQLGLTWGMEAQRTWRD